jgi:hypothetical protein
MSLQQQQGPSSSTIATGGQFPITADEAEFSASFSAIFSQSSFLNNQSCGNLNGWLLVLLFLKNLTD